MRNKITAGLLALFLGSIGIHKFYLGKPVQGVVYMLLSWTGVPTLISIVEGIVYLVSDELEFNLDYNPLF